MNIFVLSPSAYFSAYALCDKHVPKMLLESIQMLVSALRSRGITSDTLIEYGVLTKAGNPIKGGYKHHPCTIWTGRRRDNFIWLLNHAQALSDEYARRFGKKHALTEPLKGINTIFYTYQIELWKPHEHEGTPFAQAMPEEYQCNNAVVAYRNYYLAEKHFAKWEKGRPAPSWYEGDWLQDFDRDKILSP